MGELFSINSSIKLLKVKRKKKRRNRKIDCYVLRPKFPKELVIQKRWPEKIPKPIFLLNYGLDLLHLFLYLHTSCPLFSSY